MAIAASDAKCESNDWIITDMDENGTNEETENGNNSEESNGEVAGSSSSAPLTQQMALHCTQLFKNAPRDGKMHSLVDLVGSVGSVACAAESASPAPAPSADRTDNHELCCAASPDMRREDERLKTFDKWPVAFLRPQTLASNGFYYLGRGDEVRCAFCKVEIMRWEEGDDPAADHARWAPQCPFLRRRGAGNVPLDAPLPAGGGVDECGARPPPPPRMPGPVHPSYAAESARLRSFSDWPRSMRQKPEDLAAAGFFYTGQGDKTKCFYCDGGLKDWEDDDVPWEQHARWFGRCAFVQLVKGREYVQKVMTEAAVIREPKKPNSTGSSSESSAKSETETEAPAPAAATETTETSAAPAGDDEDVEDSKLCKICYAEERNICFVPCGHVVACARCALALDKCPTCRRSYVNAVRIYYS